MKAYVAIDFGFPVLTWPGLGRIGGEVNLLYDKPFMITPAFRLIYGNIYPHFERSG
jgi:hypothetical protein